MGMTDAIKAMMEADLDAAVADISATLVSASDEVTGTASPLNEQNDIDGDGILKASDYEFVGKRDDFEAGVPVPHKIVTLDGVKCVVDSVIDDGALVTLRLSRREDRTSTGGII